jgi:hypothetical protein
MAISGSVGIAKLHFNKTAARLKAENKIKKLAVDAAHVFFLECANRVPVATGMAKSSLTALADWLSGMGRRVTLTITPRLHGSWAEARLALGPSLGKQDDFLIIRSNQYGIASITFEWDNDVPHWQFLELGSNPHGGNPPWYAITEGIEAAARFIDENAENYLPDWNDLELEWNTP